MEIITDSYSYCDECDKTAVVMEFINDCKDPIDAVHICQACLKKAILALDNT